MPSGKKSKQARRVAAAAPPPVRSKGSTARRQADPKVLAIAGGAVAVVAIVVVLILVFTGGSGSGGKLPTGTPTVGNCATSGLPGCSDVEAEFKGIPQKGLYLGSAFAPAQMTIFIDLQCPYCQNYETTVMPTIIRKYVRTGKLRVKVEPWAFIGTDSFRGQRAMLAAANQNKAWNFAEVLYLNQKTENTGWLNDAMVAQAAASVDGLNVPKLWADKNTSAVKQAASDVGSLATTRNVTGTPTIFVGKTASSEKNISPGGSVPTLAQTEAAIDALQ
ncbi:MAG: thioredoxin domain-containing protein [Actinomycetota bacterium]